MEESPDELPESGRQDELAKLTERKLKIRRRAVLLSIATIFTVTAIILLITVVQEEINKRYGWQVSWPPKGGIQSVENFTLKRGIGVQKVCKMVQFVQKCKKNLL